MEFNLFLIIIIALIIIFCILYNGLRILLAVEKDKGIVKYELKATILKIAIFKREGTKGNDSASNNDNEDSDSKDNDDLKKSEEEAKDKSESKDGKEKPDEEEEFEDERSLKEKYEDIKPILKKLIKSREELKSFLNNALKTINLKKLEGNLIIGLSNHATTVKIASWIWSIGAIVNSTKPTSLTVEPKFTEDIIDFEGKMELKINLLLLLIYSLVLLTKRNIIDLIREIYRQNFQDKEENNEESEVKEQLAENEAIS